MYLYIKASKSYGDYIDSYYKDTQRLVEILNRIKSEGNPALQQYGMQASQLYDSLYASQSNVDQSEDKHFYTQSAIQQILDNGMQDFRSYLAECLRSAGFGIISTYDGSNLSLVDLQPGRKSGSWYIPIEPIHVDISGVSDIYQATQTLNLEVEQFIEESIRDVPYTELNHFEFVVSTSDGTYYKYGDRDGDSSIPAGQGIVTVRGYIPGGIIIETGVVDDLDWTLRKYKLDGVMKRVKSFSSGKKPRISSSKVDSWNRHIDLRHYFSDVCFDQDGEFDGDLVPEDEWVDFSMYNLQSGFGNPRKLYLAVLNKAGVPVYSDMVNDLIENTEDWVEHGDDALSFHIYGLTSDYGIDGDIYFGFDMRVDGSKAVIELAYSELR